METVDEFEHGFGWIQDDFSKRCSHALVVHGDVWLIDPIDDLDVEERVRAAGTPVGVIQLLDRHNRDCAALAERLQVPHHVVPREPLGPFEFLPIRDWPVWREVALWWPAERVLVCGDAMGTVGYFRLLSGRVGLHPLLRLRPPSPLKALEPDVILCGHGPGVF